MPDSSPPERESIADLIEEALEEAPAPQERAQRPAAPSEDAPGFDPSQALDFGKASSRRPSAAAPGFGGKALRALYAPVASPRRALLLLLLLGAIAGVAYKMQLDDPRVFDDLMQTIVKHVRTVVGDR